CVYSFPTRRSSDLGDGGVLGVPERGVVGAGDLQAVRVGVGADHPVGGAREHVVAADQVDPGAPLLAQVVQGGDDLLVGGGAGVDDVGGGLHPIVLHRVEQQTPLGLEDLQHGL